MTINLKLTGRLQLLDTGVNLVNHKLSYDITSAVDMKNRERYSLAATTGTEEVTLPAQASVLLVTSDQPIRIATDSDVLGKSSTFVADAGTDILTMVSSYGWYTGKIVQVSSADTLPAGLSASTDYYVISKGVNKIQLATSLGNAEAGTNIDITNTGTGIHTVIESSSDYTSNISESMIGDTFLITGSNVRKVFISNPSAIIAEVRISAYRS